MTILVDSETRVLVQGLTGSYGRRQVRTMMEHGTQVVAGVVPGRGGERVAEIPIFDTVDEAVSTTAANTSIVYVPPRVALGAGEEAIAARLRLVVIGTEGIPLHDTLVLRNAARSAGTRLVGPNTLGLSAPGCAMIGGVVSPGLNKGNVGVLSRSGTLMLEALRQLASTEHGVSTAIGMGGDRVIGTDITEYLELFEHDDETNVVVMLGELGGRKEYDCLEAIRTMRKPVVALIVGRAAPADTRMGHAGAVVSGDDESAASKRDSLASAGAHVVASPWEIAPTVASLMRRSGRSTRKRASRSSDELLYEHSDGVTTITINRPEAANALNHSVRSALWDAFQDFESDPDARVAILTAAGDRAFSAGADLTELSSSELKTPPRDFLPVLGVNIEVRKPVVAAVNGAAYGGGFLLAQMCDLCIAVQTATFAIAEARWGRAAPWAAPLPWLIPERAAMELLLTAEPFSAQRAYEVGLANAVVDQDQLATSSRQLATTIAGNAPLTVAAHKRMIRDVRGAAGADRALQIAQQICESVYQSADAQEGPRAFAEKRRPSWQGR
jgi:succinyl-CoA synthetase alpha subunit